MNNIFISYAKEDADLANNIRLILMSEGFSVWWDDHLETGSQWEKEVYNVLTSSEVILVLWTSNSTRSDWVKHEASIAKLKKNLVQIQIGEIALIPSIFRATQATDLTSWNNRENHPDFYKLTTRIKKNIRKSKKKRLFNYILVSTFTLLTLFLVYYTYSYFEQKESVKAKNSIITTLEYKIKTLTSINEKQKLQIDGFSGLNPNAEILRSLSSESIRLIVNTNISRLFNENHLDNNKKRLKDLISLNVVAINDASNMNFPGRGFDYVVEYTDTGKLLHEYLFNVFTEIALSVNEDKTKDNSPKL